MNHFKKLSIPWSIPGIVEWKIATFKNKWTTNYNIYNSIIHNNFNINNNNACWGSSGILQYI